ncbi:MAG: recombinase [Dyadobacter sp. 50-39]|uniref:site-specific integrase n=1 Tax=Dyadobacter sp. 50-39 TaxID=1895756 RepID=UPI0009644DB3|nr:site-specific integrase [Dyadobacter sp. 50-39]OJV19940.1 MAG: recombinase [Dyadobacter sp. 50-39]
MEASMNVLFSVRKSKINRNRQLPIYIRVTIGGSRFETSTGKTVLEEKWSAGSGRVKGSSIEAREINGFLDSLIGKVHGIQRQIIQEGLVMSIEVFKNKWLGVDEKSIDLLKVFEDHNSKVNDLVGIEYAYATYMRYQTTLRHTREFIFWKFNAKQMDVRKLNFQFISAFEFYLKSVKKVGHNATMKYLANLKKIVLICVKSEFIPRDPFFAFKMAKHEVDRTALTEQEMKSIEGKNFDIPRLEQVRDIFLFCCYTGLAYADVAKLKASNIGEGAVGEKWINIKRQKTDSVARIPLLPQASNLLRKYANHAGVEQGFLLPVLSNQKMNAYLKEIGDVCNIRKPITFHLARHTFATTVTLSNGVPIESVSRMLGHRSLKTTQIYAKVVDSKLSQDMRRLSELLHIKDSD